MKLKIIRMNGREVNNPSEGVGPFEDRLSIEKHLMWLYGHENVLVQKDGTYDTLSKSPDGGHVDHCVWQVV